MSRSRSLVLLSTILAVTACQEVTPPVSASAEAISVPSSNLVAWASKAPIPTARGWFATEQVGGILYAIGGNSFGFSTASLEAYDPTTNTWTVKAPSPTRRYDSGTGVINGLIYVAGGCDLTCGALTYATMDVYDPLTNSWSPRASMATARFDVAAGAINGKLYIVGGQNGSQTINYSNNEEYDPLTNSWAPKAAWPNPRTNIGVATVLNGKLFVAGGVVISPFSFSNALDAYDPATNSWTTLAPLPTARCCATSMALNGKLYVIGGFNPMDGLLSRVDVYDPVTNTWAAPGTIPPLPLPRSDLGAQGIGGIAYATSGAGGTWHSNTWALEGLTPPNQPPVANAGADQTVACSAGGANVTLNGAASTDDGSIANYEWFEGIASIATGASPTVSFTTGVHTVTLRVTDNLGVTDEDEVVITVQDGVAPTITLTSYASTLWPPNHQMVLVARVSATDACDANPTLGVSVTSNEPVNGTGDGDTAPDWTIVNNGDGTFDVSVRAERKGNGVGRTYTITANASDAAGNPSSTTTTVKVPKSQGKP